MSAHTRFCFGAIIVEILLALTGLNAQSLTLHAAQATPTAAPTATDQQPEFLTINMINAEVGWALVETPSGDPYDLISNEFIVYTQDGGKTWLNVTPPGGLVSNGQTFEPLLYFMDATHAWLYNGDIIWATHDAGHSWSATTVNAKGNDILWAFSDPSYGNLIATDCCAAGNVWFSYYQTSDGGLSWQNEGYSFNSSYSYTGLAFESRQNSWTTGYADIANGIPSIDHSHWGFDDEITLPPPPNTNLEGCVPMSPQVFGPGSVTLFETCDYDGKVYLYHTDNDGRTWRIAAATPELYGVFIRQPEIYRLSASVGWMVAYDTYHDGNLSAQFLKQTLDGGQTWSNVARLPPNLESVYDQHSNFTPQFDFVDKKTGWVIDTNGILQKTTDSGKTWSPVNAQFLSLNATAPEMPIFTSIHMVSAKDGWALAYHSRTDPTSLTVKSLILHTSDGGKNWHNVSPVGLPDGRLEPGSGLITLPLTQFFLDKAHAWLTFNNTILRTDNGGLTWTSIILSGPPPTNPILYFLDPLHGWLLADGCCSTGATIYRTSDGGISWQRIGSLTRPISSGNQDSAQATGLTFTDSANGWITFSNPGSTGTVSHSSDGGKTWALIDLPTPSGKTLQGCDFVTPTSFRAGSVAFVVQCPGNMYGFAFDDYIYFSKNEGKTWRISSSPQIVSLQMLNSTVSWAVVSAGNDDLYDFSFQYAYQTFDGGQTWTKLGLLDDALILKDSGQPSFDFIDPQTGWAVDVGGRLQITHDAGKTWSPLHEQFDP